jgi:hypothetical protein
MAYFELENTGTEFQKPLWEFLISFDSHCFSLCLSPVRTTSDRRVVNCVFFWSLWDRFCLFKPSFGGGGGIGVILGKGSLDSVTLLLYTLIPVDSFSHKGLLNLKGFTRTWSWPTHMCITEFDWRDWGIPRNSAG